MSVEYDNSVKSTLTTPKFNNFDCTINLNLAALSLDGKKGGNVNAALRDYVTHIFGSYTGKMECIGFKTSNGKFYQVGDCKKGTPFIIGKFGEKFHGVKIGLKDGISSLKPSFKKGWFSSPVPAHDDDYIEDELIDDEVQCQTLNGAELEYALFYFDEDENMFPITDPEDNPNGQSYDQVVYGENQEKVPASSYLSQTDFSGIKKKVLNLIKPAKNAKQIQDEERKKQEIVNSQMDEYNKNKKKKEDEVKTKLDKPVSILDKLPKDIPIYFSQEIPKKGVFVDKQFPSDSKCLFGPNKELPAGVEQYEVEDWDKIVFCRAKEIFESDNYQVFIDKIEPGDILQGALGNCYFLSAIATIAEEAPDLIKKRFLFSSKSSEGLYGIYVRVTGMWKLVIIDDFFPSKKNCAKPEFAFTRANGPELWVVLLEKVWSKICGSYVNTIGGMSSEVFNTFTHSYTESINLKRIAEEVLWEKLLEGEAKNFLMSAGTGQKGSDKGLTPGHAYSLLRAKEVLDHGVKTRLVEMRNPWGEGEWSGEWSDKSDKWTKQLQDECQQVGSVEVKDGKFWMNFKDYLNFFEVANICKIHKGFHDVQLNLNKTNTDQHFVSSLVIEEDGLCYIQIHQKYKRFILKDGTYPKQTIFTLMLLDDKLNYIESVWSENNIECIEIKLKKGQYYLLSDINYRLQPGEKKHGYSISCYSEKKCKLEVAKNYVGDDVLMKVLISYARLKLKPIVPQELKDRKREDAKCYKKTLSNNFPGHLYVFENSTSDLTFDATVRMKDCINAGIYDFQTHNYISDSHMWSKEVKPNTCEVVYVRFATTDPRISYLEERVTGEYCNMSLKETDEMIEKATWEKGQKAELDTGCGIWQYTLQNKKGFGIGFENKSKKKFKINVEWELTNLAYTAIRGVSTVEFDLEPAGKFYAFLGIINPGKKSEYQEGISFDFI